MKATCTRDLGAVPGWNSPLIKTNELGRRIVPKGTVIDKKLHPETDPVAMVKHGDGVPADEECWIACGMSPLQVAAAQSAAAKLYTIQKTEIEEDE